MSCYYPLYGQFIGMNPSTGKRMFKFIPGYIPNPEYMPPNDRLIPCGQCIGCRLDKSRDWADRMIIELEHSKTAVFATLTYSDDDIVRSQLLPDDTWTYTLYKPHCQKFMKDLRARKEFLGRQIRFYLCGEYGSNTARPHYHAILFGISLEDFKDLIPISRNHLGQYIYTSPRFTEIWGHGITSLAEVSWETCAYVARYVTKKLTGKLANEYEFLAIQPEFALMSRKPGIAGYYVQEHPELLGDTYQYLDSGLIVTKPKVRTPKYLFNKLEFIDPDMYNKIKRERKKAADDSIMLELSKTDLGLSDYLVTKEANHLAASKKLIRTGDFKQEVIT